MILHDLTPQDVAAKLADKSIVLIDVREPDEYAAGHIAGALLVPLSRFNPKALPATGGKPVVFQCAVGGRSAKAVAICQAAGLAHDSHLAGGITAWRAAGLPVEKSS